MSSASGAMPLQPKWRRGRAERRKQGPECEAGRRGVWFLGVLLIPS